MKNGSQKKKDNVDGLKVMNRNEYDLSHFSMKVGKIGALQTFSLIPVNAGDSMRLNFTSVFRLSPLRRYLYMDCNIKLMALYIPHRHIYGSNWTDFIKGGYDEAITLGTDTLAAGVGLNCCGFRGGVASTLPRWATRGYIQIWNRYFRDPSDTAGTLAENYWTTVGAADTTVHYGLAVANLKRIWNTALLETRTTADYRLALDGGEVDLYNFAQLQGRLKTEQERDWFDLRYSDLMEDQFGAQYINIDADQRPEILAESESWISGYDVDGTDNSTLGYYAGKGQGIANLSFPWKFFQEHGALWIVGVLRFPPVHTAENHFLIQKSEPTYQNIAGDPDILSRQGPYALDANELFVGSGSVALGSVPFGQWFREHPSSIHLDYELIAGHPFLTATPTTRNDAVYCNPDDYDSIFQSLQLKHWNSQGYVDLQARRYVPDPKSSIFAGTGSNAI